MKYNFDEFIERKGTNSGKWEFMNVMNANCDADTLPFWVADMDFACPAPVIEALHKRVDNKIFGYSANYTGKFFRAVGGWMQHRHNWYVNSQDIFTSPGIVSAIGYLINIMTEEGDKIIVQPPVYRPFYKKIEDYKRVVVENPLINNNGYYEIDFDDLEEKVKDDNTKLFIMCSPHNPVGRVWTRDELKRIGEICFANNVRIISDEIHHDLVYKGYTHIPTASLFKDKENMIVTCTSGSKTFNLAGLHYSNIIIHDDELKKKWNEYAHTKVGSALVNPLSVVALQAAYTSGEDWLNQVTEYIYDNLKFVKKYLAKHLPLAEMNIPQGTYFAWINIKKYLKTQEMIDDIDSYLVKNANIFIEGGKIFGEVGADFIRMNVACPRALLEEGLRRLVLALKRLAINEEVPDFNFCTPWKRDLSFHNQLTKATYVLFLRYYGCTICQLDLLQLKDEYAQFVKKDIQVYVVLQSDPELIKKQIDPNEYPFEIICDPEQELYKEFSISPALNQGKLASKEVLEKIAKAQMSGIEHGEYEGNELQLPAAFLIDENKKIKLAHYGKNAADIPKVEDVINLL